MSAFGKRDGMIIHVDEPFNAESPRDALADPFTPLDAFYVRNHGPVPPLDPASWRLRVGGLVERELELTIEDVRALPASELIATLQCAGNRRAAMAEVREIPGESPWGPGATGTALWRGPTLASVLELAGVRHPAAHVGFAGADHCAEADPPQRFGGSVPLGKAVSGEVLLAWEMDGAPLTPVHGAPLRVVVPGWVGARSVKWVERIDVRSAPWDGYYQSVAYRLLPPGVAPGRGAGEPLGELAVVAELLTPGDGETVPAGTVELRGYGFAGGNRHVVRVDVSADGGRTWQLAELLDDLGRWAWRHWRTEVELAPGEHELVVRAWDSASAVQPEDPATLWNPKGYMNTAWGRTRVRAARG
jgi:sulfite oxidase